MLPLIAACVLAADPVPVEFAGLTATPPAAWKSETPSNAMRSAQFKLAKADATRTTPSWPCSCSPAGPAPRSRTWTARWPSSWTPAGR